MLAAFAGASLGACVTFGPPAEKVLAPTGSTIPAATSLPENGITPTMDSTDIPAPSFEARLLAEAETRDAGAIAWSPDGRWIALGERDGIVVLDAGTLEVVARGWAGVRQNLTAYSHDGRTLATVDDRFNAPDPWDYRLWDAQEAELLEGRPANGSPQRAQFTPEGDLLVVIADIYRITVIARTRDAQDLGPILEIIPEHMGLGVAVDWGGDILAAGVGDSVQFWELEGGTYQGEASIPWPIHLEFTRDGRALVGRTANSVLVWDRAENRIVSDIPIDRPDPDSSSPPVGLALAQDGRWAATGTSQVGLAIGVWDLEAQTLLAAIPFDRPGWIPAMAFNPPGNQLAVLLPDGRLQLWEIAR